ncbi:MAG TPA: serine hydrolase [Candidatus Sulfotelmatobacter sp.]|nr:serine hydrolase [Candidatus Sulfotelmatobacter sp.]
MKKLSLYILLLIVTWEISPALAADGPDKPAKIDKLMSQYADCCQFSGTVLVSEHDKVIFEKGYGWANREWNVPNTPDVKFRLGSITKQFTAMLIMQQVAKGSIKLDGHLSDYLPYYRKDTGSKVTISQLLSHTSGIPSFTDDPKFFSDVSRNYYAVDDFVKKFCSGDLQFEPGTKFHYDNSGFFLLGAILEHLTGKTYEALLQENIFVPLKMKDTGYDHHDDILPKRAAGYEQDLMGVVNAPYLDMALPYAAGSLYSTVEDLYKWDQALYTDKLLPNDLKQKLFTPNLENYGFGWDVRAIPVGAPGAGQTMVSHEGGINGFNTLEERLVGDHDLIVIFNNVPGANLDDMAKGVRAVLYGQEPVTPKRPLVSDLGKTVMSGGADAAVARYRELKRTNPSGYNFDESALNQLGYMVLGKGRNADAIAIFKLNVEEYPKSGNVYDSLAEAYAKDGQKQLAIANYRKSIELDPKNQGAADKIKQLEQK